MVALLVVLAIGFLWVSQDYLDAAVVWTHNARVVTADGKAQAKWDSVSWASTDTALTSGNRFISSLAWSEEDTSQGFDVLWLESAVLYLYRDSHVQTSVGALNDSVFLEGSTDGYTWHPVAAGPVWSSATSADTDTLLSIYSQGDSTAWGGGEAQRLISGLVEIRLRTGCSHRWGDTTEIKAVLNRVFKLR